MHSDIHNQEIEKLRRAVMQARDGGKKLRLSDDLKARIMALSDAGVKLDVLARSLNVAPSSIYRCSKNSVNKPQVLQVTDQAGPQIQCSDIPNPPIEIHIGNLILIISQKGS